MTERYLGSIISPSPVEPSEGFADSTASGVWNVHDPLIFGQAGDWPDPTVASPSKFIENLFSCFAYTGTGSARTITNNIDLANNGGLVWMKSRSTTGDNSLFDTNRISLDGSSRVINTNNVLASRDFDAEFSGVSSTGFGPISGVYNTSGETYISWTFRKQPKFFDIVTYTGDGSSPRQISHSLGSVPGMMLIRAYSLSDENWVVYHRGVDSSSPEDYALTLNSTTGRADESGFFNDTAPTSSVFTVGANLNSGFGGGVKYVAYLFAHNNNDGGFGSTGDQDIIKCGSYTGNGSTNAITLGFEPQWLLIKKSSGTADWLIADNIRGINTGNNDYFLKAQDTDAEFNYSGLDLTSTGFTLTSDATLNQSSGTFIYVAIRRGPMQAPTAATSVFDVETYSGNGTTHRKFTTNFVVDANITSGFTINDRTCWGARLYDGMHETSQTAVSYYNLTDWIDYDHNDGYDLPSAYQYSNLSSRDYVSYSFSRAPKFFDVVTYAGDGSSNRAVAHNLEVAPEFIVIKSIANADNWRITTTDAFPDGYTFGSGQVQTGISAFSGASTPNATNFYVSNDGEVNASGRSYVAYLFATLAGISKVGTYSGTGNDVNVDCGFTNGARFVLVKRKDSSGDWYHWDSESGIVAGNDPYLLFNSDAAQVTNTDYIDPLSSGFTITSNAGSDLNASGGTYLFLAIA
tara:strand:- start:123 stop:2189 length:2067 start_codon:yes stop_codon:yes gene_type:complete